MTTDNKQEAKLWLG